MVLAEFSPHPCPAPHSTPEVCFSVVFSVFTMRTLTPVLGVRQFGLGKVQESKSGQGKGGWDPRFWRQPGTGNIPEAHFFAWCWWEIHNGPRGTEMVPLWNIVRSVGHQVGSVAHPSCVLMQQNLGAVLEETQDIFFRLFGKTHLKFYTILAFQNIHFQAKLFHAWTWSPQRFTFQHVWNKISLSFVLS